MSDKVENELVKASWVLSKAHPEYWSRFINALHDYTRDRLERSISTPASEVNIAVGMARQALDFSKTMRSLDTLYEKIRNNEVKR